MHEVNLDRVYYCKNSRNILLQNLYSKNTISQVKLTKRELEIVRLICLQKTTPEIAILLKLENNTINTHRKNLLDKTGSKNTAGLVMFARDNSLV